MNSKESDDEIFMSNVYLFNTFLYELLSVKFDSSFGQHLNDPHFMDWEAMWQKLHKIVLKIKSSQFLTFLCFTRKTKLLLNFMLSE